MDAKEKRMEAKRGRDGNGEGIGIGIFECALVWCQRPYT
jgi:hypothetical protein